MEIITTIGLGLGTVFLGLVFIIILIEIMHFIANKFSKKKEIPKVEEPLQQETIEHGILVAAIASVIAEDMGKDISAIRINSIKKI